ncbi:MAG: hypothetical protein IJ915_09085 [Paludibacteraceae bacterium]|nr:hypothetical protein [Paludibacteraceae bacterium]
MTKKLYTGFSVCLPLGRVGVGFLAALAVCLVSCKTTQLPPLDDAYYWPEKNTPIIQNTQSNQQSTIKNQKSPIIEYLNVQDTTVTVRIKR